MEVIFFGLWYLLPAGIGNMTPILAAKLPLMRQWNQPLDGGRSWRGRRIFGPHKTIRGLLTGIVAGLLIGLLQKVFADDVSRSIALPPGLYQNLSPVYLGGLLAAGALAGDAIESFCKRQAGIVSGNRWFPFDQIDYIIGACLAAAFIEVLSAVQYAVILAVWFVIHLVSSYIGYLLKLKSKPI